MNDNKWYLTDKLHEPLTEQEKALHEKEKPFWLLHESLQELCSRTIATYDWFRNDFIDQHTPFKRKDAIEVLDRMHLLLKKYNEIIDVVVMMKNSLNIDEEKAND